MSEHHEKDHDQHKHDHGDHGDHGGDGHDDDFYIHIDHKKYDVKRDDVTGSAVRQMARPPIGPEYDLFLETPGPGDDEKVADDKHIHLVCRMSFYSVPRHINPGAGDGAA